MKNIPKIKLNRQLRSQLEQTNRQRLVARNKEALDSHVAVLIAAANTRLQAEWGDPEKQADMRVMQKYQHAAPVKGANLRVYDPHTKRYDQTFGVQYDSDILIPSKGYGYYHGEKPGEYYDCYIREDEPDYPAVYKIVEWRREGENKTLAEIEFFRQAIRETTSYSKLVERFPWLDEDQWRPHWATPQYADLQRTKVLP